jgi:GNAT superfamily N-acetyltransferase
VLIAVVPGAMGTRLASLLLSHAVATLTRAGFTRARLRAGGRNRRAVRFYLREGWTDVGEHPTVEGLRVFERALGPGADRVGSTAE